MANKRGTAAGTTTAEETGDRRPYVAGLDRAVLHAVCLREVSDAHGGRSDASGDDTAMAEWEAARRAEAADLAIERFAAGTPVEAWWYDLPKGLPAPLDQLGRDPAPRHMTIIADDRVDAGAWFGRLRRLYEKARHYPNCDHAYFREAFALAGEFGV